MGGPGELAAGAFDPACVGEIAWARTMLECPGACALAFVPRTRQKSVHTLAAPVDYLNFILEEKTDAEAEGKKFVRRRGWMGLAKKMLKERKRGGSSQSAYVLSSVFPTQFYCH